MPRLFAPPNAEAETFWSSFLKSLTRRGLGGVKLVISDAHEGLKAAIRRVFGASGQRCRVHWMRNALSYVPKAQQSMAAAALRQAFLQPDRVQASPDAAARRRPVAAEMAEARRLHRRQRDRRAVLSRLPRAAPQQIAQQQPAGTAQPEVKRPADVVGIFPDEAAIIRRIGAVLLEQNDEWQLQHRSAPCDRARRCRAATRQGAPGLADGPGRADRRGTRRDAAADPPVHYLVGTPKRRLTRLEKHLVAQPWQEARPGVQVKLLARPGELYVLAQSRDRVAKQRAMWRRQLKRLWTPLKELSTMQVTREELLMKLGAARDQSRAAWRLAVIEVAAESATFSYRLDRNKLRRARSREGR